jgi:hypothetical protein
MQSRWDHVGHPFFSTNDDDKLEYGSPPHDGGSRSTKPVAIVLYYYRDGGVSTLQLVGETIACMI